MSRNPTAPRPSRSDRMADALLTAAGLAGAALGWCVYLAIFATMLYAIIRLIRYLAA